MIKSISFESKTYRAIVYSVVESHGKFYIAENGEVCEEGYCARAFDSRLDALRAILDAEEMGYLGQ